MMTDAEALAAMGYDIEAAKAAIVELVENVPEGA